MSSFRQAKIASIDMVVRMALTIACRAFGWTWQLERAGSLHRICVMPLNWAANLIAPCDLRSQLSRNLAIRAIRSMSNDSSLAMENSWNQSEFVGIRIEDSPLRPPANRHISWRRSEGTQNRIYRALRIACRQSVQVRKGSNSRATLEQLQSNSRATSEQTSSAISLSLYHRTSKISK